MTRGEWWLIFGIVVAFSILGFWAITTILENAA